MNIKALNKKAGEQSVLLMLMFIGFWLVLTLIVAYFLFKLPDDIKNQNLVVGTLPNSILTDRIYNRISYNDPYIDRTYPGVIKNAALFKNETMRNTFYIHPDKDMAFNATLNSKSSVFNKEFYDIARPLAPVRYGLITAQKQFYDIATKKTIKLKIEQVYSKK